MKFIVFLATFLLAGSALALEPEVSMEGSDLSKVPQAISSVIASDSSSNDSEQPKCTEKGEIIPLTTDHSITTWFVTTNGNCNCGAAHMPHMDSKHGTNRQGIHYSFRWRIQPVNLQEKA